MVLIALIRRMLLHALKGLKSVVEVVGGMRLRWVGGKMAADLVLLDRPQRLRQRSRHLRHLAVLRCAAVHF